MGTYAITGSCIRDGPRDRTPASGEGHAVIGCRPQRCRRHRRLCRRRMDVKRPAKAVLAASSGKLDGAVLAAGLGPGPQPDRPRQIAQVNYLGVVELLSAWRPALAAAERAKVVAVASNSTTTVPAVAPPNRASVACARRRQSGAFGQAVR